MDFEYKDFNYYHMKVILNPNFIAHKWSFFGAQPVDWISFVAILSLVE